MGNQDDIGEIFGFEHPEYIAYVGLQAHL